MPKVNNKYNRKSFWCASIVDFEQVNGCRGALPYVNIITQSLKIIRCSI